MKKEKIKNTGITLIALIITIIVLLVLAGVSISIMIGDNGVVTKAQNATLSQRYSKYLEDFQLCCSEKEMKLNGFKQKQLSVFGTNIKKYIGTIEECDVGKFAIINGELYLLDNTENDVSDLEKTTAVKLGIKIGSELGTLEEIENLVVNNYLNNIISSNPKEDEKIGDKLISKTGNSTNWKIVTELNKETGKVKDYGTGYYYIAENSSIGEIGKIKNGYLIDYDSLQIIKMDNTENYTYTYMDIYSALRNDKWFSF